MNCIQKNAVSQITGNFSACEEGCHRALYPPPSELLGTRVEQAVTKTAPFQGKKFDPRDEGFFLSSTCTYTAYLGKYCTLLHIYLQNINLHSPGWVEGRFMLPLSTFISDTSLFVSMTGSTGLEELGRIKG